VASVRDHLHRYWFRWDADPRELPPGAALGYGVTAVDRQDAEKLLSQTLLGGAPLPAGADVAENVDVRNLDRGHVLPNMGDPSVRGVWYPRV
jgi:hypothetical protein